MIRFVIWTLFAAVGAFAALQTWRLQGAQESIGRVQAQLQICASINAQERITQDLLRAELAALVDERRRSGLDAEKALQQSRAQVARIQRALAAKQDEMEAIYESEHCKAWADMPVCPAVDRRLRQRSESDLSHPDGRGPGAAMPGVAAGVDDADGITRLAGPTVAQSRSGELDYGFEECGVGKKRAAPRAATTGLWAGGES